jgi:4,5-dihydroxyphthalate decarboxylase
MAVGVAVTLAVRDYDFTAPLALGDVRAEGIELAVVRTFDALQRVTQDPAVHGGEASFSRYVQRLAAGDRTFVGLPAFVMREFRHRNFFVRRGSPFTDLTQLAGTRIGLDAWPASGNTWSRGLLRQAGIPLDSVHWVVGAVNPGDPPPAADALPPGVAAAPLGRPLRDLLLGGELDVLVWAWPPAGFYERDSPIARLYPDYRAVEQAYYRRTRIYPAHHIVVLRRALVEREPGIVGRLYAALREARAHADRTRLRLHESSPWLLADLEEQRALMGADFQAYGYRENREMVAAFCAEQAAQGLVPGAIEPDAVFADFEALTR